MTDSQMNRLKDSQSWMGSMQGKAYHAATGQWFPDEMRKELVNTMRKLEEAKESRGAAPPGQRPSLDEIFK